MAIRDTTIKPYIQDRDENVFIGIDYPFHKSSGVEGWFKSTSTTIEAVKNNINLFWRRVANCKWNKFLILLQNSKNY